MTALQGYAVIRAVPSRRKFLAGGSGALLAGTLGAVPPAAPAARARRAEQRISLDGDWLFRTDPGATGERAGWFQTDLPAAEWTTVRVPHTWQVARGLEEYRGVAWYRRAFDNRPEWAGGAVRLEFEAVFHSATVWVNGRPAGEHLRKGYTAFSLDITPLLGQGRNVVAVKVDNAFDDAMLPRGRSSDWAHDGGIYRPAWILVTPPVLVERVAVDAVPDLSRGSATVEVTATVRNTTRRATNAALAYRVMSDDGAAVVREQTPATAVTLEPGEARAVVLAASELHDVRLWHFDRPNLYRLEVSVSAPGQDAHELAATFGIRRIEVRDGGIYLNGERVRLMGVERMAGSNPEFGMAEPAQWIAHDHDDMQALNCVFTRVHWPQDARVLDYCDRHGILLQTEVPAWGSKTFEGATAPPPALMQNGLDQLTEMIERDRNHPCIFSWGLCNEVGGQGRAAYEFARRLYEHAKRLDPRRPCSYASHSLRTTPARDVSALMDFVELNEYYGSWYPGTDEDLRRNLKEIHDAFPGKPIVISEYGYCACTPDRPEGDGRRIDVLRAHTAAARDMDFVAGLIFFCYNDYRTHVGDKGTGATRQRVHGVVDLYGSRKPSYDVLRSESSPIESLTVRGGAGRFDVTIAARNTIPAYALSGYTLRGIRYGGGDIPLERIVSPLPTLLPGRSHAVTLEFSEKAPVRIRFDVCRPSGSSAFAQVWVP